MTRRTQPDKPSRHTSLGLLSIAACPAACLAACLAAYLAVACSTLSGSKPQTPVVELADISLSRLGLSSQEFAVTLDVFNPNKFDLPIRNLDFNVSVKDEQVISGSHGERLLLAADSSTQTTVSVQTRLNRILQQILLLTASDVKALDYTISGFVELENWPVRIPFTVNRSLDNPNRIK